ncbi:cbb3-type cytochrome c oxidase subunit I [Ichthyenterobacterium magnum]|uniref:Nitric oxide reductase subunit B n=1 Tax=Ichthyenterobacterium magnum TaxID=1230530 RepID=A0A420DVC6_9FLAO|nr:cbb3-type cytochrome c oxidase subunit I [Ichthyenterobacterium magnum]RKE98160.1 nitric oxide reductase subunit B [Ichthyenterobacterium magnum]
MKNKTALLFLIAALYVLILGTLFGLLASLQYSLPDFLKELIPLNKMRPLHTTTVISWIILSATGSIYFYISKVEHLSLFSFKLQKVHLGIFMLTGIAIYVSLVFGKMEGREYLAFTPILTIPILLGWFLFGINYFKTIRKHVVNWPIYFWMWGTGIVFIIYHLCEAYLWLIPSFRTHFIKDTIVQWKSYGSFVGSWNMLVYGIAIYVMSKIKNDVSLARGKKVFFFYFLGLSNLMLGWAHHTYFVPTLPWIRYLSYGVSMTEWILLIHIIYSWKKSLTKKEKQDNSMAYKFLMAADFWVFINLIIALLISIPAINLFTHGTHITVAHSMGTTIGINTSILLASLFFIVSKVKGEVIMFQKLKKVYYVFNSSLLVFFSVLLFAGAKKANWMFFEKNTSFSMMQDSLYLTYIAFFVFGLVLATSITILAITLLKVLHKAYKKEATSTL